MEVLGVVTVLAGKECNRRNEQEERNTACA